MRRFAGILMALLLAGSAALLWLPRMAAPHVQSAYEAAALLEQDAQDGGEGVRFRSALVSRNLAKTSRIVPHVSTCGVEAEEWSLQYKDDPLYEFWADAIKLQLLGVIGTKLREEVRRRYFPEGDMSAMGPGSLAAWPLTEQRPLFALLGGVTPDIGARLTDSCLILPSKSNSGFFFSAESHYENCRYCPLIKCPNRRAPFEHEVEGAPKDE